MRLRLEKLFVESRIPSNTLLLTTNYKAHNMKFYKDCRIHGMAEGSTTVS